MLEKEIETICELLNLIPGEVIAQILAVFLVVILVFGCFLVKGFPAPEEVPPCGRINETTPIYSLERSDHLGGSFVLGTGSVSEHPVYYFYMEKDGGYILTSANAEYTILVETNATKPRYEQYGIISSCNNRLFVPEGTIKKQFKANGG